MEGFRRGRDFAAWLGLVPRQHSTGGKPRLGKLSKMGQRDLSTRTARPGLAARLTHVPEEPIEMGIEPEETALPGVHDVVGGIPVEEPQRRIGRRASDNGR